MAEESQNDTCIMCGGKFDRVENVSEDTWVSVENNGPSKCIAESEIEGEKRVFIHDKTDQLEIRETNEDTEIFRTTITS